MILGRHILKEHIAPFVFSLVVITGIFMMDFVVQVLDTILSKQVPWPVVLELFALNMAWMLALSIPMSVLVSTLMAFGRMSADREIDAMRASGLHPARMLAPVLIVASLLTVGLVYYNNRVLPQANYRASGLREDISRKRPTVAIQPRTLIREFRGFRIWIEAIDPGTDSLRGVQIHQLDRSGRPTVILASAGTVAMADSGATWLFSLRDGETHSIDNEDERNYLRVRFRRLDVAVPNVDSRLQRSEKGYRSDREMPIGAMREMVRQAKERRTHLIEEGSERQLSDLRYVQSLLELDDTSKAQVPAASAAAGAARWWSGKQISPMVFSEVRQQAVSRRQDAEQLADRMRSEEKEAARYEVEIHKKFSIPVACIVFVLIGAPLGVMARSGGLGTGVIYSLAFFILYWICLIGGESQADQLRIAPWQAMWLPNMVLGTLGLWLSTRMGRESQFFRYDWFFTLLRGTGLHRLVPVSRRAGRSTEMKPSTLAASESPPAEEPRPISSASEDSAPSNPSPAPTEDSSPQRPVPDDAARESADPTDEGPIAPSGRGTP